MALLKRQRLDKCLKPFIGNESGIYGCRYFQQNLGVWMRNSAHWGALIWSWWNFSLWSGKDGAQTGSPQALCSKNSDPISGAGWCRAHSLFLKCIPVCRVGVSAPSSSHIALGCLLGAPCHVVPPFHGKAESKERCNFGEPMQWVWWGQSTLSSTVLVGHPEHPHCLLPAASASCAGTAKRCTQLQEWPVHKQHSRGCCVDGNARRSVVR